MNWLWAISRRLRYGVLSFTMACCWLTFATYGQLTQYVPFETGYTPGADLNGQGGSDLGFGTNVWFDGAPAGTGSAVVAGNLTAPMGLPVAGDHARTDLFDFNLAFYTFDADGDGMNGEPEDALQPGEHWISFVGRSDLLADFGGFSLEKFFGDEILYIGKIGGFGGSSWGVDAQDGNGGISAGGDITVDTFLVAKLTLGPSANDDVIDLFINPPLGTTPPATADLSLGFNEDAAGGRAIDEIRIGSQGGPFFIDEIRIGATFADVTGSSPAIPGDFNHDNMWNCTDINLLSQAIASGSMDLSFDMNGDGMITRADINEPTTGWLAVGGAQNTGQTGGNAFIDGDANLSGAVDGSDFGNWNMNKFSTNANYCDGDFDASGGIDGSDFGIWNGNKFTSSAAASAAVPEPVSVLWTIFAALSLTARRSRRDSNA